MRKINADRLKHVVSYHLVLTHDKLMSIIDNEPTVEEVTGEWIEIFHTSCKCNRCGATNKIYYNYCGHCGSKNSEVDNGKASNKK